MSDHVLEDFMVRLGWKVDEAGQKKMKESIAGVAAVATNLATILAATATAAALATAKMAEAFNALYYASRRTGASVKNLEGLSYAFSQLGGNSQQASSAVESFARNLRTNPGVRQFVKDLGVATMAGGKARDTVDVLGDAIEAIRKRNPYEIGHQYAQILGIDEGTFNLMSRHVDQLKQYRAEYDRTTKIFGLNSDEAAKAGRSFAESLTRASAMASVLGQKLLMTLAPVLDNIVKGFGAWVEANGDKVQKLMDGIASGVERFANSIGDGSFRKGLDEWGDRIDRIVKGLASLMDLLTKWGFFDDKRGGDPIGRVVSSWLGKGNEVANGEAKHNEHQGSQRPGLFTRGLNWLKRKTGIGAPTDTGGGGKVNDNFTGTNAEVTRQAAKELGTTPEELAAVISYETGGTFSPKKWGGKGGNYMGLIQFGGPERKMYGAHEGQTYAEQMGAVVRYLKHRGFKPGMGLLDLYSTINAGRPGLYDRSDGNGTVRSHAAAIEKAHLARARQFLNSGAEAKPALPPLSFPQGGFSPGGFDVSKATAGAPLGSATNNYDQSSRSNTVSIKNEVKIDAGGDPARAASYFERAVDRSTQSTLQNLSPVVR